MHHGKAHLAAAAVEHHVAGQLAATEKEPEAKKAKKKHQLLPRLRKVRVKIGNPHLRWAFAEAACLFLRQSERARRWKEKQEKKRGPAKALGILAAKLARAVYHVLTKQVAFDESRFWNESRRAKK